MSSHVWLDITVLPFGIVTTMGWLTSCWFIWGVGGSMYFQAIVFFVGGDGFKLDKLKFSFVK